MQLNANRDFPFCHPPSKIVANFIFSHDNLGAPRTQQLMQILNFEATCRVH